MKKRIGIIILLIVVAATVFFLVQRKRGSEPASTLYGNVDIREVALGFRVNGRVAEVLRDEGDAVKQGDVLARLDAEPYKRALQESQSNVAAVRARVQLLKTGSRPEEIAQARAVLGEREATLANADRHFKRMKELFQNKTVSVQDVDDAEAKFREAEARVKSAGEQLRLAESGFRAEEIEQATAELARAEAALSSAALRLEDCTLQAPSDGVVLTRALEPGAIVQLGQTILTLSLSRPVWIRAYVHEPELGTVQPGRKVEVYTDSRPDRPYTGQVGFVSPRAEFTPKNVETRELRTSLVYRLRIVVEDPDEDLRQGMPVTIRLR